MKGKSVSPVEQQDPHMALKASELGLIWAGTLFGVKISDWVLVATLIYTVLRILELLWDRLAKPWLAYRARAKATTQVDSTFGD
jgi:hypothetical protein